MISSPKALKAFCIFYNARKDPTTRNGLLEWLSEGTTFGVLSSDVAVYSNDFNLMRADDDIKIAVEDIPEIARRVAKAFNVTLRQ